MATATWSVTTLVNSDASFRTTGGNISTQLQAMSGLTKTSDTGQINWTTVTYPGTANTDAGYEVYYLNDSLHATAPIYFKITWGRGFVSGSMRMKIEFGTGSNGAGTLTGTGSGSTYYFSYAYATGVASPTYTSYLCVTSGFLGFWYAAGSTVQGLFTLERTVDATGAFTTKGMRFAIYGHATTNTAGTRYSSGTLRYDATAGAIKVDSQSTGYSHIHIPFGASATEATLQNGDYPVYLSWEMFPELQPMIGLCGVWATQIPSNNTFSVALVGTTAHTYLSTGTTWAAIADWALALGLAFLWE